MIKKWFRNRWEGRFRPRMRRISYPAGKQLRFRSLSPLERGFERWRPALQPSVRTLAVIGFCCAATILIYHLPFNWLGVIGSSMANLPSYLMPG